MYAADNDNRRSTVFLIISVLLHIFFVLLAPGMGLRPAKTVFSDAGAVEVTVIPVRTVSVKKPPAPPVKQPVPVKTVEAPSQPTPKTPPRVATGTPTAPPAKDVTPQRVLTEPASPEPVKEPPIAEPVREREIKPEPETSPVIEKTAPEPQPEPPPQPPRVGDVVSGHGLMRHYPAKEAALLARELRARVEVTVTADGRAEEPRLLTPSGYPQLDEWVTKTAQRQLRFSPASSPYRVVIEVLVNPQDRKVTLNPEGERVRFVEF